MHVVSSVPDIVTTNIDSCDGVQVAHPRRSSVGEALVVCCLLRSLDCENVPATSSVHYDIIAVGRNRRTTKKVMNECCLHKAIKKYNI